MIISKKTILNYTVLLFLSTFFYSVYAENSVEQSSQTMPLIQKQYELQQQQQILQQQLDSIPFQVEKLKSEQKKINESLIKLNARLQNSTLEWATGKENKIPKNAIIAGYNQKGVIHICRANYYKNESIDNTNVFLSLDKSSLPLTNKGVHPGQLVNEGCLISYGGKAYIQKEYTILVGEDTNVKWQSPNDIPSQRREDYQGEVMARIMAQAAMANRDSNEMNTVSALVPLWTEEHAGGLIIGGYENNIPLAICRVMYDSTIRVGKLIKGACNISDQGVEKRVFNYELLMLNNRND